jgi:hypothetical protein
VTPNRVSVSALPLSQSVEARAEEVCGFAEFSRPREWAEADWARAMVMKRLTEPLGRRRMAAEALVERFGVI